MQIDGQRVIEIEIALRQPGIVAQVEQLCGIAVPTAKGGPIFDGPSICMSWDEMKMGRRLLTWCTA